MPILLHVFHTKLFFPKWSDRKGFENFQKAIESLLICLPKRSNANSEWFFFWKNKQTNYPMLNTQASKFFPYYERGDTKKLHLRILRLYPHIYEKNKNWSFNITSFQWSKQFCLNLMIIFLRSLHMQIKHQKEIAKTGNWLILEFSFDSSYLHSPSFPPQDSPSHLLKNPRLFPIPGHSAQSQPHCSTLWCWISNIEALY